MIVIHRCHRNCHTYQVTLKCVWHFFPLDFDFRLCASDESRGRFSLTARLSRCKMCTHSPSSSPRAFFPTWKPCTTFVGIPIDWMPSSFFDDFLLPKNSRMIDMVGLFLSHCDLCVPLICTLFIRTHSAALGSNSTQTVCTQHNPNGLCAFASAMAPSRSSTPMFRFFFL